MKPKTTFPSLCTPLPPRPPRPVALARAGAVQAREVPQGERRLHLTIQLRRIRLRTEAVPW